MTEIGTAIRDARQAKGMTIKELAEAADVDEATVGRIERGVTKNPSKAGALQKVLGIGIYKRPEQASVKPHDPRLSEASVPDLLGALNAKYYSGQFHEQLDAALTPPPRERAGTSGIVTPRYDGSEYDSEQEADRANRPGAVG